MAHRNRGLPFLKMVIFHGYVSHNQMVTKSGIIILVLVIVILYNPRSFLDSMISGHIIMISGCVPKRPNVWKKFGSFTPTQWPGWQARAHLGWHRWKPRGYRFTWKVARSVNYQRRNLMFSGTQIDKPPSFQSIPLKIAKEHHWGNFYSLNSHIIKTWFQEKN